MADTGAAEEPVSFARRLADKLSEECRGQLRAAILHGSAVLGGWMPSRSDVDVLFIVADSITEMDLRRMTVSLVTMAEDCPGTGIETSIVSEAQARNRAQRLMTPTCSCTTRPAGRRASACTARPRPASSARYRVG